METLPGKPKHHPWPAGAARPVIRQPEPELLACAARAEHGAATCDSNVSPTTSSSPAAYPDDWCRDIQGRSRGPEWADGELAELTGALYFEAGLIGFGGLALVH